MKIIELILDEQALEDGVQAMSVVTRPAIKKNFVTLKEQGEDGQEVYKALSPDKVSFRASDKKEQILMGPAMIPNMMIYREDEKGEPYYNYFSPSTIKNVSQIFMKNGRQNSATIEHEFAVGDMTVVESWIVEDPEMDKSKAFGLDVPKGTWMISQKVYNKQVWDDFIETGILQGFSIEGFFSDGFKGADEKMRKAMKSYYNFMLRNRALQAKR